MLNDFIKNSTQIALENNYFKTISLLHNVILILTKAKKKLLCYHYAFQRIFIQKIDLISLKSSINYIYKSIHSLKSHRSQANMTFI